MAVEANATLHIGSELSKKQSDAMNTTANAINWHVDPNMQCKADYYIYIFNVGQKSHPLTHPLVKGAIPGCKPGQKYLYAFRLPNLMKQIWANADTGFPQTHTEYGERVATDLINPANLGVDQWAELDKSKIISSGQDLSNYGVFWSLNETPNDAELAKITAKMQAYYRILIKRGDELARLGKLADITEDMHMAAEYFQYKAGWHAQVELPDNCPNCGEEIKKGIAYHKNSMDMICIIDADRAAKAGVKIPVAAK